METNPKNNAEIDLAEILGILISKWKILLVSALSLALATAIITIFVIPKQYESKISMYVNNNQTVKKGLINLADINASKSLVNTYMAFLQSECILDKVVAEINHKDYNIKKVKEIVKCNQVNATEIFEVKVKTTDPLLSAKVADFIAEIAPSEIQKIFKSGSVEVVDTAKVAQKHIYPSIMLNTAIGSILGLIVSACCVLLIKINDQTIRTPKDFEDKYNIPLLGVVPDRLSQN